jgi:hypothetical protein
MGRIDSSSETAEAFIPALPKFGRITVFPTLFNE